MALSQAAGLAEGARPSNFATDLLLCALHLGFLWRGARKAAVTGPGQRFRRLVLAYICLVSCWQAMGAYCHLWLPAPSTLSALWFAYLSLGALCPALFGILLAEDQLPRRAARWASALLAAAWLAYCSAAAAQLDLADLLPLPRRLRVVLPAPLASHLYWLRWMPSALRAVGQRSAGEAPLPLLFDGRGYASIPFELSFDAELVSRFDLTAPFPCWQAHCLPCLFLFFTFGVNVVLLAVVAYLRSNGCGEDGEFAGLRERRRQRATGYIAGGLCMLVAIPTIPITMALWGVAGGIDFMHICALPGMYVHLSTLERAMAEADGQPVEDKKVK